MSNWHRIKHDIQEDLLSRDLKEPRIRLRALDRIEELLAAEYSNFIDDPGVAFANGETAAKVRLTNLKAKPLNSAEKSIVKEICKRLKSLSGVQTRESRTIVHPGKQNAKPEHIATPHKKSGLAPLIWLNSRLLIVGSLPGDESLRRQQYYANARNQFWRILASVYQHPVPESYDQKIAFLQRHNLALWDVLAEAHRRDSLDSNISDATPNNFKKLRDEYPQLCAVAFNGGKAERLFKTHVEKHLDAPFIGNKLSLPSSSPTPGRNVLPLEEKIERWQALRQITD